MSQATEALLRVMNDVPVLHKEQRNRQQNFTFRGIDDVMNVVGPALRKHGLYVRPIVLDYNHDTIEVGADRRPMSHVRVKVEYQFVAADGSHEHATMVGEAFDVGDKATSKAMSMAYKYALLQALCLPTDEPDPDASNYERSPAPKTEEARDAIAEVRNQILDWTKDNERDIREVAREFAEAYSHPITEATVDELNTFYAKLSLGGKTEEDLRREVQP